jgi:hypothetical protein
MWYHFDGGHGGKMDVKSLPVRHMVEDDNGLFKGIALMSPEGFRDFLTDRRVDKVALRVVTDKDFGVLCRAPLDPLCLPYFTMDYEKYFISFHESN